MRKHANPFWSGLVTAIVLVALMVGVMISGIPAGPQIPLPWNQKMTLHVQLVDADALAPHASVEIAGVKVGEVQSVDSGGTHALATLQIDQRYSDIHNDATIFLRAHGLFGPKYIAIVPGTAASPALRSGDTILVNHTVQPVDLNAILQDLQKPEQQNLRTTIVELGTAAAGRGDDVNHLLLAASSLTKVLQTPLNALDKVSPQLSDMLVKDEQFNNYFAQTPLDQLVANSEQTVRAFAANAGHLQSLVTHADSALSTLDTALSGQGTNLASIIQQIGTKGGTIDRLNKFEYLLGLFGANLTGKDTATDPADRNVISGIIGAIENVRSAFYYADPCPKGAAAPTSANDNHCSVSPDGKQHFLHVRVFNFPPAIISSPIPVCLPPLPGLPPVCLPTTISATVQPGAAQFAGQQLFGFSSLIAS